MSDQANETRLHVVHVTPWLSRYGGGVSAALWGYARHGLAQNVQPTAVGIRDPQFPTDSPEHIGIATFTGKLVGPRVSAFSPEARRFLRNLEEVDLFHVHGLRHWLGVAARREAIRRGVPLVVSTHGMLYPWLLDRNRWRKSLTVPWERANFRAAKLFHATSVQEVGYLRAYGLRQPIAVVPLGIDDDFLQAVAPGKLNRDDAELLARWPELRGKQRLLILGLMDRKKGLLRLAEAWGRLAKTFPRWHLVIAGPDQDGHEGEVRNAIASAGVTAQTTITGAVYGEWKTKLFAAGDLFVLPTDWENFGIAIAEAMAAAMPVITTQTTPWADLSRHECGWWIEPGIDPLAAAMDAAMRLPDEQRREMGRRGRRLIEAHYTWPALAHRMRQAYDYARGGPKPEFVYSADELLPPQ